MFSCTSSSENRILSDNLVFLFCLVRVTPSCHRRPLCEEAEFATIVLGRLDELLASLEVGEAHANTARVSIVCIAGQRWIPDGVAAGLERSHGERGQVQIPTRWQ